MNALDHETADEMTRAVVAEDIVPSRSRQVVVANPKTLMGVIARAAADPATDVEKLERLMGLYERITSQTSRVAYSAALSQMQPSLPVIEEKGLITIREKGGDRVIQSTPYALWEDINEAIRPHLSAHGFALSFRTGLAGDGRITVTGILSHRDGHQEETTIVLPHDSTGSKNAVQAIGSSTSYGKRYTAMALLNLTSRGEDDDGRVGGDNTGPKIGQKDIENLIALADVAGADKAKFCAFFKVESFADIPQSRLKEATDALERKRTAKVRESAQ